MGFPNYAKKLGNLGFFFSHSAPKKLGISWENIFQDAWKIFSSLRILVCPINFGQIILVEFFPFLLKKIQENFFPGCCGRILGNFMLPGNFIKLKFFHFCPKKFGHSENMLILKKIWSIREFLCCVIISNTF